MHASPDYRPADEVPHAGKLEAELFAQTYKNYGLATVRYPVLEVTAAVDPFENGRGLTLRGVEGGEGEDGGMVRVGEAVYWLCLNGRFMACKVLLCLKCRNCSSGTAKKR
jgi:hypothetical protein